MGVPFFRSWTIAKFWPPLVVSSETYAFTRKVPPCEDGATSIVVAFASIKSPELDTIVPSGKITDPPPTGVVVERAVCTYSGWNGTGGYGSPFIVTHVISRVTNEFGRPTSAILYLWLSDWIANEIVFYYVEVLARSDAGYGCDEI
jgi:hypothetical protein